MSINIKLYLKCTVKLVLITISSIIKFYCIRDLLENGFLGGVDVWGGIVNFYFNFNGKFAGFFSLLFTLDIYKAFQKLLPKSSWKSSINQKPKIANEKNQFLIDRTNKKAKNWKHVWKHVKPFFNTFFFRNQLI
jgi:hypothetical protein